MDVPSQAIKTLMEIGVAAAGSGLSSQALTIFAGIEAVRPQSEGPAIGVALIHMNRGEHDEAIRLLRDGALVHDPKSLEARMILAVALKLGGRNAECEAVAKELNASSDPRAKAFAASLAAR